MSEDEIENDPTLKAVSQLQHEQRRRAYIGVGIILIALTVFGIFVVQATGAAKEAEESSKASNAVLAAFLANIDRSSCITDLRSIEDDADGRQQDALVAGLTIFAAGGSQEEILEALEPAIGDGPNATVDRQSAARDLLENLNEICGEPISAEDIPELEELLR